MESLSVDLDEMLCTKPAVKEKGELNAYCNSYMCSPKTNGGNTYIYGSVKSVTRSTWFCPDCGSALFWGRSNGKVDKRTKNKFLKKN